MENKRLILIGGGHAHLAVLRSLFLKPKPDLDVTLISREPLMVYPRMIPDLLAGRYGVRDVTLDWVSMCAKVGVRFLCAEMTGLSADKKLIHLKDRGSLEYDLVSLNIGSRPSFSGKGIEFADSIKPFDLFLKRLEGLSNGQGHKEKSWAHQHDKPVPKISIIGAGAGGIELSFALNRYFRKQNIKPEITLYEKLASILPRHHWLARRGILHEFEKNKIRVKTNSEIEEIGENFIRAVDSEATPSDMTILMTQPEAWPMLKNSGLETENGFVLVNDGLQSVNHSDVLAAGDCCLIEGQKRLVKSTVASVKQGAVLAENLIRKLSDQRLTVYKPKNVQMALISNAAGEAYYSYGLLYAKGPRVMKWKARADKRFIKKHLFEKRPAKKKDSVSTVFTSESLAQIPRQVLEELNHIEFYQDQDITWGLKEKEDVAVITKTGGSNLVQSVNYFRCFMADPYLMGQIAATQSLSNIYAKGAKPHSAQAIVTLPHRLTQKQLREQFAQILHGAAKVFKDSQVTLVGGHTSLGQEVAVGFVINSFSDSSQLFEKKSFKVGDQIVMTKPLGTGTMLAALHQQKLSGADYLNLTTALLNSNEKGSQLFHEFQGRAATDISGYGLLGSLEEVLEASGVGASLDIDRLPCLPNSKDLIRPVPTPTHSMNRLSAKYLPAQISTVSAKVEFEMLFDPQFSGGLLLGLPASKAKDFVMALQQAGYSSAAVIGAIIEGPPKIKFRTNIE